MKIRQCRFESCSQFVSSKWFSFLGGVVACGFVVAVAIFSYSMGARTRGPANLSEAVVHATASHGSTNVAVATGQVSEDAEGIFILDYITGNLQCWVFYPRMQRFGAKFETNITAQLPATKNADYLMVTGTANVTQTTGNTRPAGCLVYIVDAKSGAFAAYSMPWSRPAEMAGELQKQPLVFVAGDKFRTASGGASAKVTPPPLTKDATKEKVVPPKK